MMPGLAGTNPASVQCIAHAGVGPASRTKACLLDRSPPSLTVYMLVMVVRLMHEQQADKVHGQPDN